MTDRDPQVDPEVEALLIEAAKNPRSVLLKVERPKELSRVVAQGGNLLVTHKTGLPSVEKKLLDVYREEAAYLLRLAYFELSDAAGFARNQGQWVDLHDESSARLGPERIAFQLNSLQGALEAETKSVANIAEALPLFTAKGPGLAGLVHISLKLASSSAATSYVGEELILAGEHGVAQACFTTLLRRPMESRRRSSLLTSLASIHAQLGLETLALRNFKDAAALSPSSAHASLNWLWCAIHVGDGAEAREAAVHVDTCWPDPPRQGATWLLAIREQRRRGVRCFKRPELTSLRRLSDSFGTTSGFILDAALDQ
jgi:hypothetical protein